MEQDEPQVTMSRARPYWLGLTAAAAGAMLLLVADTAAGQHAHAFWLGPAKLIGALLLVGPLYLAVLAVARTSMQPD